MTSQFNADEARAAARAAADGVYGVLLTRRTLEIGYYAPVGRDEQKPHTQDEIYLIHCGHAHFDLDGEARPCTAGDVLFVPAGVPHRFQDFSPGFGAWVIFYGPEGGDTGL